LTWKQFADSQLTMVFGIQKTIGDEATTRPSMKISNLIISLAFGIFFITDF
jgi:hypothetical protein